MEKLDKSTSSYDDENSDNDDSDNSNDSNAVKRVDASSDDEEAKVWIV